MPRGRGQFCTYTQWRSMDMFEKPKLKTEVLSIKPLVVLFHNFTTKNQQKAIAYMGYEQVCLLFNDLFEFLSNALLFFSWHSNFRSNDETKMATRFAVIYNHEINVIVNRNFYQICCLEIGRYKNFARINKGHGKAMIIQNLICRYLGARNYDINYERLTRG